MIELTRRRRRLTRARIGADRNAPSRWRLRPAFRLTACFRRQPLGEPSTSGAPYSVQTRLYEVARGPSSTPETKSSANSGKLSSQCVSTADPVVDARKRTEPVASSSGFPTDLRRSDCRSESHQPRTLRTRCIADSRGDPRGRQGTRIATSRKLRSFLFTRPPLRSEAHALDRPEKKNGRVASDSTARIRRAGNAFVHLPDEPSASA